MRKLNLKFILIFVLFSTFLTWACQKGISWGNETVVTTPVVAAGDYSWSTKINDTAYAGCIDTAYYQTAGTLKTLIIQVTGNGGESILLGLVSSSGSFSIGTYGSAANNGTIIVTGVDNDSYTVVSATNSFSFTVTGVNDTLIQGTFSASLSDASNKTLKITEGKVKALVGKTNPCGSTTTVTDSSAVFTLIKGSANKCATVNVKGTYKAGTDMNATNEALVDIDVTKTGKYTVTTATTNGISFTATGTFTATGSQTLTLKATGNPVAAGATTIPISAGSSNCDFIVTVL